MKLWQKIIFFFLTALALVPVVMVFAVITMTTSHTSHFEMWIICPLCLGIVLLTVFVWKGERLALVPAIALHFLYALWCIYELWNSYRHNDYLMPSDLVASLVWALPAILAAIVMAVFGERHCGCYLWNLWAKN